MRLQTLLFFHVLSTLTWMSMCSGQDADSKQNSANAVTELRAYLQTVPVERKEIADKEFATVALTAKDSQLARELLWNDHLERIKHERKEEMKERVLSSGELKMPFFYSVAGKKPENGRSLYISMHGGGGAPKKVNDQQWENQKRLYKIEEGVYVAPRAPTDAWNLWHQGHIDGMFDRLIENFIVFEGVDPNRVYLMGYSAGGDGVYQLAPRMADRFAAASMMAGHPNEASPLGLRNIPFSIHVGEKDAAYDRNKIAAQWGEQLDALQKDDREGYTHWTKIYQGKGHWLDRKDAEALPWMAKFTRNPFPRRIVWRQDDVTHARFYWLAIKPEDQRAGVEIRATLEGQTIKVQSDAVSQLSIRLNDRMLDMDQEITVSSEQTELFKGIVSRNIATLAKTLSERGDPNSVFDADIAVQFKKAK